MDLSDILIRFASKYLGLSSLKVRWNAIRALGKGRNLDIPPELIALNLDILSRSLYNINAIQTNPDWVWPFWVERQYDPEGKSFLPASYLSINLTHRNWTAVACPESDHESLVDPRGLVTPLYDGWSVDHWIRKGEYNILPAKTDSFSQHLVDHAPVVKSLYYKKGLRSVSEVFMHKAGAGRFLLIRYTLENQEVEPIKAWFGITVRPYNPESVVPVFSIDYDPATRSFCMNGTEKLFLDEEPVHVVCSSNDRGDAFFSAGKTGDGMHKSTDRAGLCTAFAEYPVSLNPGEGRSFACLVPLDGQKDEDCREVLDQRFHDIMNLELDTWAAVTGRGIRFLSPDSRINEAFASSRSNLLVLVDKNSVTPGPFTYHHMWFRDAAYSITALLKCGYIKESRAIIQSFFKRQQPDGYFRSQKGEWDANGQVLWTVAKYCRYANDRDFFISHLPSLKKAAWWIFKIRKKTMKDPDSYHYGLLPSGYSAEHFGPANYYYWDDFWAYAGVRDLTELLRFWDKEDESLEEENKKFLSDIERSILRFQERTGENYIPSSPYRGKDSSMIGSLVAVYPLQVIDPLRKDMVNTLRLIRKRYMKQGAFFHRLIHSGFNIYLTAHVAECYLVQNSAFLMPVLNWIMDHATDTWTFPEAIHPETGGGCMGDGHHGWATSEMIHLLRNMIFIERNRNLVLFPMIPHHWLDRGNRLSLKNAPSLFGPFDLELTSDGTVLDLDFKARFHAPPETIVVCLPQTAKKIEYNGTEEFLEKRTWTFPSPESIQIKIYL